MKIICIGRNYSEHAKELNNDVPESPVFFMKPDTALLRNNDPFYYPEFTTDLHHEVEIVVKICKVGKNIEETFAPRYYEEIGIGIDFTARDVQNRCKAKGLPWEIAKSFDFSAPICNTFLPITQFDNVQNINFSLDINEKRVQTGNTKDMIFNINQIISYVSKFVTLKIGDLIYTGTPSGVGPVKIGDNLKCAIEGKVLLDFEVK